MELIFILILAAVVFLTALTQIGIEENAGWYTLGSFVFIILIFVFIGVGIIT